MNLQILNYDERAECRSRVVPHSILLFVASFYLIVVMCAWNNQFTSIFWVGLLTTVLPFFMIVPVLLIQCIIQPRPFHVLALCGYIIAIGAGAFCKRKTARGNHRILLTSSQTRTSLHSYSSDPNSL